MKLKAVSGIMLSLLLIGMLILTFNIQPVKSDWTWTETIYIRADGSVDPDTAPISTVDSITYTLTDNIVGDVPEDGYAIVVERDNIVIDGVGYTLQGTGVGIGIYLFNRTNVTIKNMEIKSFYHGIYLWISSNNIIYGNNIAEIDEAGIALDNSSNNTVFGNFVTDSGEGAALWEDAYYNTICGNDLTNNGYGIHALDFWSEGQETEKMKNTIYGNNITNNTYGISLTRYHNNTIHENDITNNLNGIFVNIAGNNTIYHNNFINNTLQVSFWDSVFINVWDDGYPSGGNYWSNYNGTDFFSGPYQNETGSDDIGDTPYVIDENNTDYYPLTYPWGKSSPVGGISIPINKLELLAPYIGLTILLAVAVMTVASIKKRKRNTEINS